MSSSERQDPGPWLGDREQVYDALTHPGFLLCSCKAVGTTRKQLTVCQLPPVLCLHLKRFEVVACATGKAQVGRCLQASTGCRPLSAFSHIPAACLGRTPHCVKCKFVGKLATGWLAVPLSVSP